MSIFFFETSSYNVILHYYHYYYFTFLRVFLTSLDGLHSSSYSQVLQSLNHFFETLLSAPITTGVTVTFIFHSFFSSLTISRYLSLFSLSFSPCGQLKEQSPLFSRFSFLFIFCWLSLRQVIWPRLDVPFVSQNPRELFASHFLGQILGCAYNIGLYGQI